MKQPNCLNEQDLTLLHYGETESMNEAAAVQHLADCTHCRQRLQQLTSDMDRLPAFEPEIDPHNATRLAARVADRLPYRRPWIPAVSGVLSAAIIVFAVSIWTSEPQISQINPNQPQAAFEQAALPEVDLLENLELLKELDTLTDIVGV